MPFPFPLQIVTPFPPNDTPVPLSPFRVLVVLERLAAVEPADKDGLAVEHQGEEDLRQRQQNLCQRVDPERAVAAEAQVLKLPDEEFKEPRQVAVGSDDKGLAAAVVVVPVSDGIGSGGNGKCVENNSSRQGESQQ